MPELPEVETTCRGIAPYLRGVKISQVLVRQPQLRWPIPAEVMALRDMPVVAVRRRAKFLLIDLAVGQLLIHLGMSGSLRVLPVGAPALKHDHVDVLLDSGKMLRLNDPRRFGAVLWSEQADSHPLLGHLGPEPLESGFDGDWLARRAAGRKQSVKTFIMDNRTVVGVGNIYAQESLFLAGIHPSRQAGRISKERYARLAESIREVLTRAIAAGGTTLKDFSRVDGQPGYFAQALSVYGRGGAPCLVCGTTLRASRHGQRATCYCPQCQR
jgi:formamidopyrimidine-DNA glycosylase